MARPVDLLLTQASERFAMGRFEDAAGACRAALTIDSQDVRALIGLAEAEIALGAVDSGVERLVDAGRDAVRQGRANDAFALIGRALVHAPARLELHLDIAELEAGFGHLEAATQRLESLANAYIDRGSMDEATAVVEFMEAWDPSTAIPTEATAGDADEDSVLEALEALEEFELLDDPETGSRIVLPPPQLIAMPPAGTTDVTLVHPLVAGAAERAERADHAERAERADHGQAPAQARSGRAIAAPAGPRWVPTSAPDESMVEPWLRPAPAARPAAPQRAAAPKQPEPPKSLEERVRRLSALPRPVSPTPAARPQSDPKPVAVEPRRATNAARSTALASSKPSTAVAPIDKAALPPVPDWKPAPRAAIERSPSANSLVAKLRSRDAAPNRPSQVRPPEDARDEPLPTVAPQTKPNPNGDLAAKLRRQSGLARSNGWHTEERSRAPGNRDTGEFEQV